MAHSPAAMIVARMNHAPQLAPVMKSPIPLPFPSPQISLPIIVPSTTLTGRDLASSTVAWHSTTETFFLAAIRCPLSAIICWRNDDPDLVGIFGGMGTEDRGRALNEARTGSDFTIFNL